MTHLNDEQFEAALNDPAGAATHLAGCPACRQRLEELQALRGRLQSAFASVTAPAALAARIRAAAAGGTGFPARAAEQPGKAVPPRPAILIRLRRYAWPLAAAAALVLIAVPTITYLAKPSPAEAAQQELVNIHNHNLADGHAFYSESEPAKLAQFFKDKLGFEPAMPRLNQGMAIRGCCVAHFRDRIVGSYVVNTPNDVVVSIIVISDPPEAVGLTRFTRHPPDHVDGGQAGRAGPPVWTGHMTRCNMAAVRLGGYTYTAVSVLPQDSLIRLLDLLAR